MAKFSAVYEPLARFLARAAVASRPSQSPKLEPPERDPQPAEGLDPQDGGDVVLGRGIVGPVPARVGRRRIPGVGRACRRPQIGGGRQTRFRPVGGRCRPPS